MDGMEAWEKWSTANPTAPALLRGTVLHTWLTHVHAYIDGNGRTAIERSNVVKNPLASLFNGCRDFRSDPAPRLSPSPVDFASVAEATPR